MSSTAAPPCRFHSGWQLAPSSPLSFRPGIEEIALTAPTRTVCAPPSVKKMANDPRYLTSCACFATRIDRTAAALEEPFGMNRSRIPTSVRLLSVGRRVSALSDFLQARSYNVASSCDAAAPYDQDATDRRLLPITSIHKHPCLANSTALRLRFVRVGPWHFTMPRPRRRTTWYVGGVLFPCRFLSTPIDDRAGDTPVAHAVAKCGCVHPLPLVREPDCLSRPLVKRDEHLQPDVPSFYPAVPPQTRGPSFPGARADSPLSRSATSPLRFVSRHPFATHVFQSIAFPCGRASTDVRESLGPRARFRALCRTPRFFEPRCRRTNSAIRFYRRTGTLFERLSSSAPTCVDTFLPSSVTRWGGYEPRNSSQGCTPNTRVFGARALEAISN